MQLRAQYFRDSGVVGFAERLLVVFIHGYFFRDSPCLSRVGSHGGPRLGGVGSDWNAGWIALNCDCVLGEAPFLVVLSSLRSFLYGIFTAL